MTEIYHLNDTRKLTSGTFLSDNEQCLVVHHDAHACACCYCGCDCDYDNDDDRYERQMCGDDDDGDEDEQMSGVDARTSDRDASGGSGGG